MKIAVLMSTLNGEKYLREQIESILMQELDAGCELTLYIRDDGSSDETPHITETYSNERENVICVDNSSALHLGIKNSFLLLLRTAFRSDRNFEYFAFADQDDVWLKDKLSSAVSKLENSGNKKGALYYSNEFITDEELNVLYKEQSPYYGDFTEVLWTSRAFGNTMVFNEVLAEYVCLYSPKSADYHDAWIYRLAKCIGSDIIFDEDAHIYYRQHPDNSFGLMGFHKNWCHMIKNFIPNLIRPRNHYFQNQVSEIFSVYGDYLSPDVVYNMNIVMRYNQDFRLKWQLLRDPDMKKRQLSDRCIWIYKVLFNQL